MFPPWHLVFLFKSAVCLPAELSVPLPQYLTLPTSHIVLKLRACQASDAFFRDLVQVGSRRNSMLRDIGACIYWAYAVLKTLYISRSLKLPEAYAVLVASLPVQCLVATCLVQTIQFAVFIAYLTALWLALAMVMHKIANITANTFAW